MESCPKEFVENFKEKLIEENLYLMVEVSEDLKLHCMWWNIEKSFPDVLLLHIIYVVGNVVKQSISTDSQIPGNKYHLLGGEIWWSWKLILFYPFNDGSVF